MLRALEKDPARRYQSAEEFIAALEQARRAPTRPVVVDGDAVEEDERTRWWIWALVAARGDRDRHRRLPAVAGNRVEVPNLVGRQAEEVDPILERRGLEVQFVSRESDDVPRDEVISQDPEAGTEVREGSTVTVVISGGPGRCRCRRSRASRARTPSGRSRTPGSRSRSRRRSPTTCPRAT